MALLPPGLPLPAQMKAMGQDASLLNGALHLPAPAATAKVEFAGRDQVIVRSAQDQTCPNKASARTKARALLRAKARARRRETDVLQKQLADVPITTPREDALQDVKEDANEDVCSRPRAGSLRGRLSTATTASGTSSESDTDGAETTTPTSSSSTPVAAEHRSPGSSSHEAELLSLRARLFESERETLQANDQILVLKQQLERTQQMSRMHAGEIQRLEANNSALHKDLRQLEPLTVTPLASYSQLELRPTSATWLCFDQDVAYVFIFPHQLCLRQSTPLFAR